MSKRALLKILAFLVGLYFVLEYILPEKIGGSFDHYEVRSPAALVTPDGIEVFYVGAYRPELSAIGRAVPSYAMTGSWVTMPPHPLLQRSLFVPHDKWGMQELAAIARADTRTLVYIGRNPRREPVLCFAVSTNNGALFDTRGVVVCSRTPGQPVRSTAREPNGDMPGTLQHFAAHHDGTVWHLFMLVAARGLWHASGTDLAALTLSPEPVLPLHQLPLGITAFDAARTSHGWELDFIVDTMRVTHVISEHFAPSTNLVAFAACPAGTINAYRIVPGTNLVVASLTAPAPLPRTPEQSDRATALWLAPRNAFADGAVIKRPGTAATPTYLSRATTWAGQFMMIVGSFAVFMAVINLVLFHGKRVMQRQPGLHNSVVFFVFLVLMGVCTYYGNKPASQHSPVTIGGTAVISPAQRATLIARATELLSTVSNAADRRLAVQINLISAPASTAAAPAAAAVTVSHIGSLPPAARHALHDGLWSLLVEELALTPDRVSIRIALDLLPAGYDFLFKAILVPIGISVFSLITFYMVSAAYRAFKIRTAEAALLMLAACIVMLGQLPLGAWLTQPLPPYLAWLQLPWLAQKLLTVINSAAYRGVLIGIMIGGFSAGLRIWLGMDDSVYSGMEKK